MCDKPVTEYYAFKYPDQPGTTGITLQKVNELLKKVQTMQQLTANVIHVVKHNRHRPIACG